MMLVTTIPVIVSKLSPAQSSFKSVSWAELALLSTFNPPPPPGKVLRRQFQYGYWQTSKVGL